MPASKTEKYTRLDLFGTVTEELQRSVKQPNVTAYRPYPEQEEFHRSDAFGRYVAGSNRGGKTDAIVVDAILNATDTNPYWDRPERWGSGPLQLRFVVVDFDRGVEGIILPKLKRWCAPSMLIDGRWDHSWDNSLHVFTFSNGSTIDFVTHGQSLDKHGGVPRHIVYFDEEPPQDVFNENVMRLLDYDGRWAIAATPVQGMGWTYDLLWEPAENGERKDVSIHTLSAAKNPYLATKDLSKFAIGMSKEEQEIRFEGKFVARSGLVFPTFAMNLSKFVLAEPFIPPKNWDWYSSTDHGYNNPTAWYWHAVGPQGQIITFGEHYASKMTIPEHSATVHERERGFGKKPEVRVGDPAMKQHQGVTGTNIIQEYATRGIYINVETITNDVMIGIEKMQQYFAFREDSPWGAGRPTWVISPNCPNLIRELKKLRWKTYSSDRVSYDSNVQEAVHKKDDHAFDSCRYFSTLMPDLTPISQFTDVYLPPKGETLNYTDVLVRMSLDSGVSFVDDVEDTDPEPQWVTETAMEAW